MHAKGKTFGPDVNFEEIAKKCIGMSGAYLQNILNEAAILSVRK